jgi:rhodanese-related sulfurtransferase
MINTIKNMFGIGPAVDYKDLVSKGAIIVDVRTRGEYSSGHIKGSLNIPLNELTANTKKINKDKVIITCCASGMRSASAKSALISAGCKQVYNGGGWSSLQNKL